jgi:UDP-glucose 4-epimerase
MADAIVLAHAQCKRGVYNVAPNDWIAYQDALDLCDCFKIPLPSIPPVVPRLLTQILGLKSFPGFLFNYFKYPVIIDGGLFERTFGFKAKRPLREIFRTYREMKSD